MRRARTTTGLPILLALALAGCTSGSRVAELEPELFALTLRSATSAASARLGVEQARAFCARRGRAFEPVRTEIGNPDYRIAFRCPRPVEDPLDSFAPLPDPAPEPGVPGFRPQPGLL